MKIFLFICSFFVVTYSFAQEDSMKVVYRMKTIYPKGNKYMLGSEIYNTRDLKGLFQASPDGLILYEQGYKSYKAGSIISLVSSFSIFAIAFAKDDKSRLGFIVGGLVVNLVGLKMLINGRDRIHKAIWIRNADVLFGGH